MSEPRALEGEALALQRAPAEAAACGRFIMPPEFRTERLSLKPLALHQLDALVPLIGHNGLARLEGAPSERTIAFEVMARFCGMWRLYGFGPYALADHEDRILGYAGLWFPHDYADIEILYGLLPEARGKGYAAEAVRAIRDMAASFGAPGLVSYISPENEASQRVARAVGAEREEQVRLLGGTVADVWRHPVTPNEPPYEDDDIMVEASVMPLSIRTRRLTLCQWQPAHFPRFAEHVADAETMRFLGGALSLSSATRVFSSLAGQWQLRGYGFYVVEHEGRFVGSIGLYHPYNWPEPEIAYNLTADARGQGFAAEAVSAVRDVAGAQGRRHLVSFIDPDNHASQRVARSVGAEYVGDTDFNGTTDMVWRHTLPADGGPFRDLAGELEPQT